MTDEEIEQHASWFCYLILQAALNENQQPIPPPRERRSKTKFYAAIEGILSKLRQNSL